MKKKIAMIIVVIFILGLTNTQISTAAIAPELVYPFDNMYTHDQTPYFSWSLGVGISNTIQIDDEDTFATPIIDVNVGLSDTYTVPGDSSLDYGDYYWRVGAHDKSGTAWSEVRLLKIIPVPASPTLLSPTNGSYLIHNELTLDWNAQSYPFGYTCVVKNQPGNDVVDTYGTHNTYVDLSLDDGSYSWLVYIQDPISPTDYYTSTTWTFTIDTTSPQIIILDDISYVEGTNENTISWTVSDENPDFYTIYRDGVEIDTDIWNSSTITVNIDGLAAGEYEYMIIVTDSCGHTNSDTVIVTVTLSIPELRSTSFAIPIIIIAFSIILQFLRKKKRKLVG